MCLPPSGQKVLHAALMLLPFAQEEIKIRQCTLMCGSSRAARSYRDTEADFSECSVLCLLNVGEVVT